MTPTTQEIAAGIHLVITGRGAFASNAYLVGDRNGWVLVDAGWRSSAGLIRSVAETAFGPGTRPTAIVLTHLHPDHSGAAGALARSWRVPVYVHPAELPMAAGRYLPEYSMPLDRWVVVPLMRLFASTSRRRIEAAGDITDVTRPLGNDGGVPGLAGWRWVHTPGHTPGHVAYLRCSDGVLVSGDAIVTVNLNSVRGALTARPQLAGPPRYTTRNWSLALRSIENLAELEPRALAPGHGRVRGAGVAQELHGSAARSQGGLGGGVVLRRRRWRRAARLIELPVADRARVLRSHMVRDEQPPAAAGRGTA